LKKEENLEFIKKLASTQVDTSLLRSSRDLGVSKESKRELLSRALREQKVGINVQKNNKILFEDCDMNDDDGGSDGSIDSMRGRSLAKEKEQRPKLAVGSGLKRLLETDVDGKPIIKKRRRLKKLKPRSTHLAEHSWQGFSSASDSDATSRSSILERDSIGTQTESEADLDDLLIESSTDDKENDQTSDEGRDADSQTARKERSTAFKAWATQQINEAIGFTPATTAVSTLGGQIEAQSYQIIPREPEQDPLPPELEISNNFQDRKAFSVQVERSSEIKDARLGLPVVAEEQKIMEAIYNNPVVVIWGATGSGKTTQVPQFLFEAGFGSPDSPNPGMIGVTQPRRVAAVSMAKRVNEELGSMAGKVSYQIRFESSASEKTAIKYMTDGILIREIANDFALLKYSAIIIDEAHERGTNTDILIGMVSRIVDLRESMRKEDPEIMPLKLIIMSATLRISDFLENPNLFRRGAPPLIQAEGRQYPVTIHFTRRTQRDYVEEVFMKISKGHKKLPPGGMLVFLTGQNEITALLRRLNDAFPTTHESQAPIQRAHIAAINAPVEDEDLDLGQANFDYDQIGDGSDDNGDKFDSEDDKDFDVPDMEYSSPASTQIHVLPLYSQLQTKDQLRVFSPPPDNARLIVLATNVAETSLTIPGIRYVFDCGRAKDKKYDRLTGVQNFAIGWISKASASQRAGRAGRTGPGHCYRLYSSAVYERDFLEHAEPEILRMPVEGVVLQLKSMDLQHVVNFPFPTPPDRQSLAKAEKLLAYLGAISSTGKITAIGRELSIYPLSPRFSKMLLIGHQHNCMAHTIALVAALAVPDIFIPGNQLDLSPASPSSINTTPEDRQADASRAKRKKDYTQVSSLFSRNSPHADALKVFTALCAYAYAPIPFDFCNQFFLRPKALLEASHLRQQLHNIVRSNHPNLLPGVYNPKLPEPSTKQLKALTQIVAAAFVDQVAVRYDVAPSPPELVRKPTRAIDVPYLPLFPAHMGKAEDLLDVAVFIHPSSVLSSLPPASLPTYLVYSHLQRSTPSTINNIRKPRTRMHALAAVTAKQLFALARGTPLVRYGKPIGKTLKEDGKTRECWVVPELVGGGGAGGLGGAWPLPAVKVLQIRGARGDWDVENVIG